MSEIADELRNARFATPFESYVLPTAAGRLGGREIAKQLLRAGMG